MKKTVKELIHYRELLWVFTWKNIVLRYKQTVMGFLWALFMPALIVLSGIVVKKAMSTLSGSPLGLAEVASVSVKALPWAFFVGTLKFDVTSLIANMGMVKKIYFPREIFPLSYVISQFFDFIVATGVLIIVLAFVKIGISIHLLWVPLLIIFLFFLTAGFSLLAACGALFFRDIKYIVDVLLTFGIFFTPVFYDAGMFKEWKTLLLLNPMGAILENINTVVILHQAPDFNWLIYAGIWAIGGFILSWVIFKKAEPLFAEYI